MPNTNPGERTEACTIGHRVREVRLRAGMTQRDLAGVLDIPRSAVSLIESGRRALSATELRALVVSTGTSPYYVLGLLNGKAM